MFKLFLIQFYFVVMNIEYIYWTNYKVVKMTVTDKIEKNNINI